MLQGCHIDMGIAASLVEQQKDLHLLIFVLHGNSSPQHTGSMACAWPVLAVRLEILCCASIGSSLITRSHCSDDHHAIAQSW